MKTLLKSLLILVVCFTSYNNSSAQSWESRSLAFDIPANCHRINGNSWRCCGAVSVYTDGTVSSVIKTSSNRYQGFTGAMVIQFKDAQKRVVYQVVTSSFGVNGKSSRVSNWSTRIPPEVLKIAKYASVHGVRNSTNRTAKWFTQEAVSYTHLTLPTTPYV